MAGFNKTIQDWYANRLHEYYAAVYHAYQKGDNPDEIYPKSFALSPAATPADHDKLPKAVREAYDFYTKHYADEDIGCVEDYVVPVAGKTTYAILVRTDGDDGYLEVYDEKGKFLAAGRTYIEVVAWGSREWLRAQVAQTAELPPELQDADRRTLWGRPIEGFHCMESPGDHPCQFEGLPPGYCNQKVGHFAEGTPHRCSKCSFTWGGKPTNKERSIRKEKKRGE
jgi:hypothetical protein